MQEQAPGTERSERPVVVVTGSSGLIGSRLLPALSPAHQVVGLDLAEPDELPEGALHLECDLTRDASVAGALDEVRGRFGPHVASAVHLAAYYDFSGEPSPLYRELTVEGTRRLLRALRGMETEQLIFSSSLLVMKPCALGEQLDESSPVEAEWDYPRSKLEAEAVIREERGPIPAVLARIAGVYDEGGHSPPITQQMWRIRERKLESFFFPGNAEHGQAFVHLDDAVEFLRLCVVRRRQLADLEVFLVAEPDVVSYGELQDRLGELLHDREWPTLRIPAPLAKAGAWVKEKLPGGEDAFIKPWMIDLADGHYPVAPIKARERLGWDPRWRLRTSLPEMVRRMQADPRAWDQENGLPVEERSRDGGGEGA